MVSCEGLEVHCHDLFQGMIPGFTWRDWGKSQNISVRKL